MKIEDPIRYRLTARSKKNGRYGVISPCGRTHFVQPVTERGPKLYVVCSGVHVLYVGFTTQPMASRFYGAYTATGATGYYGYQWRNSDDEMHLDIWRFAFPSAKNVQHELETIEAEVVFRVREISLQWPLSQNEIHFRPSAKEHRELAARIYEFATTENT